MIKLISLITKLIVATLISLLFASCNFSVKKSSHKIKGSGNITTETRSVFLDFKSIKVKNGIKAIVEQSDSKFISVETDDNLQKNIITKVENGVLIIESDKSYKTNKTPVVTVKMPEINGLKSTSGSEINSRGIIITENIDVDSSSGSEINISVEADVIAIESSSGSTIKVSGKALRLETYSSSGSKINAKDLMTNEVISKASSGSSTSVYPIIRLEGKATSGSKISYYNSPKTVIKMNYSGGSVEEE